MRFVFLTMDGNHFAALREATTRLRREHGVEIDLRLYTATSLQSDADWQRLAGDIASADFVFGSMLFGEEYVRPLQRALSDSSCPVCIITSNPALIRCTRLGRFVLGGREENESPSLISRWISKLKPKGGATEGSRQLALIRNLGKVMQHIPGKARDIHSFMSMHEYWLNCSPENLGRMLCMLIDRYVPNYAGKLPQGEPITYPNAAIYHPDAPAPFADLASYEKWREKKNREPRTKNQPKRDSAGFSVLGSRFSSGSVGILSLRTVILSGNTAHLDALVRAVEARGIEARVAYSAGLDFRPALEQFFQTKDEGRKTKEAGRSSPASRIPHPASASSSPASHIPHPASASSSPASHIPHPASEIDLLINGAGFSLIGGMAESRPDEARVALEQQNVGYLDMIPLAFQRVEEWQRDDTGLSPMQLAMNVAIPELDGAAEPLVFGGPTAGSDAFVALPAQVELAANRIARRVGLHRKANAEKKVGVVLFNFPPNLGNIGTAAYLDVFASLHRLLLEMRNAGYTIEVPASVDALRETLVDGNTSLYGTDGNVAARLSLADYMRLFPAFAEIEPFWGRAPGELLNDGKSFYILGAQFGNVFVGLQPSFGYERDPMRLLMAKDAAPHHGFAAFYTWLEHIFGADAVVHFGTHGALEFMPGKQAGMSANCWPTRLLGSLPNFYYYSVNNPSEATIAKRRGAATLVSYMVPPLQHAGLYRGLRLLKDSLDTYRTHPKPELLDDIRAQAERLGITVEEKAEGRRQKAEGTDQATHYALRTTDDALPHPASRIPHPESYVAALAHELIAVEQRMIPLGLHVLGSTPEAAELADLLALTAAFTRPARGVREAPLAPLPHLVAQGLGWNYEQLREHLRTDREAQVAWERIDAICREAMRLFVEERTENRELRTENTEHRTQNTAGTTGLSRRGSRFSVLGSSSDAYLHHAANILPGTLAPLWAFLGDLLERMCDEQELNGLMRALDGGYIPPSPANDVVRNPGVVPTGRNIHGLDPFRVPTAAAQAAGETLMAELLERLTREQGALPETVAMVLWGTDNLKSDGEGVAQVLALLGARVVLDELGKVSDVALIPLAELGRPRIDVVVTVSGIFRDLLHHQMDLIDKAAHLAAAVPEPVEFNFVRKHALAQSVELKIDLHEASTRVFANAPGSYGANVNHLVESSTWDEDQQLSEAFLSRKCFAYGAHGQWHEARTIMERALTTVDATFQNIDSFEVGISDIDHYYENLGGITKSVELLRGERPPVMVADAIATSGRLSSLTQMVRLESRAKLLNPKWFEAMLAHGYEGVREIETRVCNTYGWSATTAAVEGWVYQGVADTFLLDETLRDRMAQLNPHATAAVARRLLEANDRGFWDADESTIEALLQIYSDLEDRLEGVPSSMAVGGNR